MLRKVRYRTRAKARPSSFIILGASVLVLAIACNEEPASETPAADAGSTGATGGAGGTGVAGTSTGGVSATSDGGDAPSTGGGGDAPSTGGGGSTCPGSPPESLLDDCNIGVGVSCHYDVDCQSGTQSFTYSCKTSFPHDGWIIETKYCNPAKPYDSCPGRDLYCSGQSWWGDCGGCDPPGSRCPISAPASGTKCDTFGAYGDNPWCGYPCDPVTKSGWQVATCVKDADGSWGAGTWQYDSGCE